MVEVASSMLEWLAMILAFLRDNPCYEHHREKRGIFFSEYRHQYTLHPFVYSG